MARLFPAAGCACPKRTEPTLGQDKILPFSGGAELRLCPTFLGGAAAPPCLGIEELCPAPTNHFRLLHQMFWRTVGRMPNRTRHQVEAAWRRTVESWLVCQGLISIRLNKNPKVSTDF